MRYEMPGELGRSFRHRVWRRRADRRLAAVFGRKMAMRFGVDRGGRVVCTEIEEVLCMKIVIWKSPKCLCGVFRRLFGMGKE